MKKGITFDVSKVKVFLPESIGHYSSKCAAGWLGLGLDCIKLVKTNNNFCYDLDVLEYELEKTVQNNEIPLAIIAYAGDSRTMSIDNFEMIYKLSKKYDAWFHIDACHGSALIFSKKYKHLINGINLADSVTLDPHKIFWMPYNLSYILIKNPENFKLISGSSDLITNEPLSMGQISPFIGSWGFHSLKLWFLFKNMGMKNIQKFIDYRTDKAKELSNKISNMKDFYVFNDVTMNSIIFMYIPKPFFKKIKNNDTFAIQELNTLNKSIREILFKDKSIFVHTFPLKDYKRVSGVDIKTELQMLRIIISNPLFNEITENKVLETIKEVAENEYKKRFKT